MRVYHSATPAHSQMDKGEASTLGGAEEKCKHGHKEFQPSRSEYRSPGNRSILPPLRAVLGHPEGLFIPEKSAQNHLPDKIFDSSALFFRLADNFIHRLPIGKRQTGTRGIDGEIVRESPLQAGALAHQ